MSESPSDISRDVTGPVPADVGVAAATPPESSGFASLAKHISRRTTDLLAIGLVLTAGLGFGRQVIEWWRAEPQNAGASTAFALPEARWGENGEPVALEFGDAHVGKTQFGMTRQTFVGKREQVLSRLAGDCRAAMESATDATGEGIAADDLLRTIAALRPFEEVPGRWRLYQVDDPFLLIVGVQDVPNTIGTAGEGPPKKNSPVAGGRVVCWGLALQQSEQSWTLYTFHAPQQVAAGSGNALAVPLPPGGRRLLSLREQSGGALVGFSGNGPPAAWTRFYDEWFAAQDWRSVGGWQVSGSNWTARFCPADGGAESVDVQFGTDGREGLTGILNIVAATTRPADKKRGAE